MVGACWLQGACRVTWRLGVKGGEVARPLQVSGGGWPGILQDSQSRPSPTWAHGPSVPTQGVPSLDAAALETARAGTPAPSSPFMRTRPHHPLYS